MTHMMMSLARGKVFVCLEVCPWLFDNSIWLTIQGGYNIESISRSALAVTQTLMGDPVPPIDPQNLEVSLEARRTVALVKKHQYVFWKCLDSPLVHRGKDQPVPKSETSYTNIQQD
jgi:histone deacetylase 6